MEDQILISQLSVMSCIGATAEERSHAQELRVSLTLTPIRGLQGLGDVLANTVDYAEVSRAVQRLAAMKERLLIETLAEEIVEHLLHDYPLAAVEVEVRKYVLPETKFVAVRISSRRTK